MTETEHTEHGVSPVTEERIRRLFFEKGLGAVALPIVPVSGGFLHRMYRVETADRVYAVKALDPNIMKRPDAIANYRRADALESVLEAAGIPIVPALTFDGAKLLSVDGAYFYLFRWQNGAVTDWYNITPAQCRLAGSIQGRIHAIDPGPVPKIKPEHSAIDWDAWIETAGRGNAGIGDLLRENRALLYDVQRELNQARDALPGITRITDEDMDPKNVMWDAGNPVVIDLECLEYGNPVSSALQLSLQWAGVTTCDLDPGKLQAFFDGYLEAYDNGFRDYSAVFGLAYTWIEWLAYNLERALGDGTDAAAHKTCVSEVCNTVARIRYIRDREAEIKRQLERL